MHHTVHDVHVPSVVPMHEGFCENAKIEIHGHILHQDHFAVELLSGPHVILHIDFRFGMGGHHIVVLNTQKHNHWGEEVRVNNPLHHNDHFHIVIKAHHTHFDVHVNGHHLADFHHRLPMESVQAVGFRGHGKVEKVIFEGFHFKHSWGAHDDNHFGHSGYNGYGTEHYVAPVFVPGHGHAGFF